MKSLFWKHIAKRSFIYKKAELMPEFEAFKFFTLSLFESNVTDCYTNLWHHENLGASKAYH